MSSWPTWSCAKAPWAQVSSLHLRSMALVLVAAMVLFHSPHGCIKGNFAQCSHRGNLAMDNPIQRVHSGQTQKDNVSSGFSESWNLNQFRLLHGRSSYGSDAWNVLMNQISCRWNLKVPVTSFWTHDALFYDQSQADASETTFCKNKPSPCPYTEWIETNQPDFRLNDARHWRNLINSLTMAKNNLVRK